MADTGEDDNSLISLSELFSTVGSELDLLEQLKDSAEHCYSLQCLTFHRDQTYSSEGGELFILSRDQRVFLTLLAQEWRRRAKKAWSASDQVDFEKFASIPKYAMCVLYPLHAAPTRVKPGKAQKIICGFFDKKISVIRLHNYQRFFRSSASSAKRSLSFDIEVYEHDQERMLEIGWTISSHQSREHRANPSESKHYIILENIHFSNGRYVPNHRYNFAFGESKEVRLRDALDSFMSDLKTVDCVVGHDILADLKYLSLAGLNWRQTGLDELYFGFDNSTISRKSQSDTSGHHQRDVHSLRFADTQLLQAATEGPLVPQKKGLQNALKHHQIPSEFLFHNAGNDAKATSMLLHALMFPADDDDVM